MSLRSPGPGPDESVLVALSGGVDSALSAHLVQQAGCRVEAVFMKNWDEDDGTPQCTAAEDYASARAVCDQLGIRLHLVSFAFEYWEQVFEPMLEAYREGQTPNPDVACNRNIKFGALKKHAGALGFDWLATGHYARILQGPEGPELLRARDRAKDQSYFLHSVQRTALERVLFPIGELSRAEVRSQARQAGLPNWNRRGSTGICFIGERNFASFLKRYMPAEPGDIVTTEGEVIGSHEGAGLYTPGQRRGLGIGGQKGRSESPWYVVGVDVKANRVVVAQDGHPLLHCSRLQMAAEPNWVGPAPALPARLTAQVRYRQPDTACTLKKEHQDSWVAEFEIPQRAPAAGQYCVFYENERCLGGAVIAQPAQSVPLK